MSAPTRRTIHAILTLAATILVIFQSTNGDWKEAGITLLAAFYAAANKANTNVEPLTPAGYIPPVDDGLTYEEAGGVPFDEGDETVSGNSDELLS